MPRTSTTRAWPWAAASGVIAAGAFFAVAELIALLLARESSPLLATGSFVIDIVPRPLKEFAISTFGTADKPVLLIGLGVAAAVAAAIAGVLQWRFAPAGVIVVAAVGAFTLVTTVTRAGAGAFSWAPAVAGTIAGCLLLHYLIRSLRRWAGPDAPAVAGHDEVAENEGEDAQPSNRTTNSVNRRTFFVFSGISAAAAVVVGAGSRVLSAVVASAGAVREALSLPSPQRTVTVPDGAELDVEGLSPLVTPNEDFYRVDTALTVPSVDPSTWSLVIDGMVENRVELSFDDLVAMGLNEYAITMTCVSNEVGGGLVGNAVWLGIPVRDVLAQAGPSGDADMVLSRSVDGYTASTPLASLTDDDLDAIIAVGMNGEPLPLEHGFPVRMVVPGLYGYVSATKWLTELKVTTFAQDEAYWTPRGYDAQAPIKFSSRIDTPRTDSDVAAGTVAIAGMAWAQTVGIERVEVSIDDGDWQQATLSTPINDDTWVQWMLEWQAEPGTHFLAVRAVNKDGDVQIEERAPIAPNGSSGWQRVLVTVR